MGFSRQEYWSGLPFPPKGDLPNPRIELSNPEIGASLIAQSVKNLSTMQETQVRLLDWEDPLEDGNLLQYSCLENLMDRGAWQARVHRVSKSQT